jgi:hypothetical protein
MTFKRKNAGAVLLPAAVLAAAVLACRFFTTSAPPSISGSFTRIGPIPVLTLRGTHYQRGSDHGQLVGGKIRDFFEHFLFNDLFGADDSLYAEARGFCLDNLEYEDNYRIEAGAMISGMNAAGVDLHSGGLGRGIDSIDILMMSSLEELYKIVPLRFGCSSFSSWGSATQSDTSLKGELVLTRHWDYPRYERMIDNLMLIAHIPSEPGERCWVSCGWAGAIGTCSGMSGGGVGAFLNYDDLDFRNQTKDPMQGPFHPVSLSIRNGIEHSDVSGEGMHSIADVCAAVRAYHPLFSCIIHCVSSAVNDTPAAVLECSHLFGCGLRTAAGNDPPLGDNLAATNHFRLVSPAAECWRYQRIIDSLGANPAITIERNRTVLAGAAGWDGCLYRIQYIPFTGQINVSFTSADVPAHEIEVTRIAMDDLF